jgi:nitrite reductase (NADH) small subunit
MGCGGRPDPFDEGTRLQKQFVHFVNAPRKKDPEIRFEEMRGQVKAKNWIAIFRFARRAEWFATQHLCPHKQQMSLSRGMTGSVGDACEPKVACPFHKKAFSLRTGSCLSGDEFQIRTYPVRVKAGKVYVGFARPE